MKPMDWTSKWTLRFVVMAVLFLILTTIEGEMMRVQLARPDVLHGFETMMNALRPLEQAPTTEELYYAMLTVHPIIGIYGFVYMAVMGAFYYLVPHLMQREVRYKSLVRVNFWVQVVGVLACWTAGFFALFNALYTLYWPLPVSFDRVPVWGAILFMVGAALVMVNILVFAFNIFGTVFDRTKGYTVGGFLRAAFGIPRLLKLFGKEDKTAPNLDYNGLPPFIVAVARGSIDTVINAFVLLTAGVLILVYAVAYVAGHTLNPAAVDALIYKNWYWWGLDMVADGNVLIYTAGIWYLMIPMLTGRRLYAESVVRTVIMVDLLVSMGVWSHHLLGDQGQPLVMRLVSGQLITWGEIFTMGLTIFASMMTLWRARPVKLSVPLLFILGSIFGFIMGAAAGIIQANVGLNVVLHNTQWVIMTHAHTLLLMGLGTLLFGVIYALLPMLTGKPIFSRTLALLHFWLWIGGAFIMTYSMGIAGTHGMLRRTLYPEGSLYQSQLNWAMIGGITLGIGFIIFIVNLWLSVGQDVLVRLVHDPKPVA